MIKYDPKALIQKTASASHLKKSLTKRLTLKKAALKTASEADFIDAAMIEDVALETVKAYKARIAAGEITAEALKKNPAQLIQRVQNAIVSQAAAAIKVTYSGEYYIWTPSEAEVPDPEHQLNYGKTFKIGSGEMPGDRIGCMCGMDILVNETNLDL